jgi:hypothetical protein
MMSIISYVFNITHNIQLVYDYNYVYFSETFQGKPYCNIFINNEYMRG